MRNIPYKPSIFTVSITTLASLIIVGYLISLTDNLPFFFVFLLTAIILTWFIACLGVASLMYRLLLIPLKALHTYRTITLLLTSALLFCALIAVVTVKQLNTISDNVGSSKEELASLPYASWVPSQTTIQQTGVIKHDRQSSFPGINIYNSRHLNQAHLMDNGGKILHTWFVNEKDNDNWHHIEMLKTGELLAIVKYKRLTKISWDSHVQWVSTLMFHHDLGVTENQDIYGLTGKEEFIFKNGIPFPVFMDYVVQLSPDGKIKKQFSLLKALRNKIRFKELLKIYPWITNPRHLKQLFVDRWENDNPLDIFHANSIEILDKDIAGVCKKGDLLISIRNTNQIVIIDPQQEKTVWQWGENDLDGQHHPTLLENGNILVFDNGFRTRNYSRVLEVNPQTKKIEWEYKANPPQGFFSKSRGGNQRLPNGNTLITESDTGRVFEVTKDGSIVWEFYNPEMRNNNNERATIYRMMRIVDFERYPKLKDLR